MLATLFWASLADRRGWRKPIYVMCSLLSALVWLFYFGTTDFEAVLAITLIHALFMGPLISFLEASSMDTLGEERGRYGRLRLWGSVNFILTVLLLGRLTDRYGLGVFLVMVAAGFGVHSMVALKTPAMAPRSPGGGKRDKGLWRPRVIVFLASGFLMLASHGAYYGFFSIHLKDLGFSRTFIGAAWAVATASEIGVMWFSERLFRRLSLEQILVFCLAAAVLRWAALSVARTAPAILSTQLLHALTYGGFHMASILTMDALAPKGAKTLGQALNNGVQYGLGLMSGLLAAGYLYEGMGSRALFLVSAGVAAAGCLILGIYEAGRGSGGLERSN